MTTLLSWIAFSNTGEAPHLPRAVYLASDSRITWGSNAHRWEAGRKVFAPTAEPHLFGFCGDVVLPALVLGQIVSAIDARILYRADAPADDRHEAVLSAVKRGVACAVATPTIDFTIHHLLRERDWPETSFRAWSITFDAAQQQCSSAAMQVPPRTDVIASFGSGSSAAKDHRDRWQKTESGGQSRAILASFCDAIRSGDDPLSGGVPQLTALYTTGGAVQIGMFIDGRPFMNGLEMEASPNLSNAKWRDELGQDIDPITGKAARGARRFGRPVSLSDKGLGG